MLLRQRGAAAAAAGPTASRKRAADRSALRDRIPHLCLHFCPTAHQLRQRPAPYARTYPPGDGQARAAAAGGLLGSGGGALLRCNPMLQTFAALQMPLGPLLQREIQPCCARGHGRMRVLEAAPAPATASSQRNRVGLGPDGAQVRRGSMAAMTAAAAGAGGTCSPPSSPPGVQQTPAAGRSPQQPRCSADGRHAAASSRLEAGSRRPRGTRAAPRRGGRRAGGPGPRRPNTAADPPPVLVAAPPCPQDPDLPLQRPQDLPWQGCAVHPRGWPGAEQWRPRQELRRGGAREWRCTPGHGSQQCLLLRAERHAAPHDGG